jgi:hypothetical protein
MWPPDAPAKMNIGEVTGGSLNLQPPVSHAVIGRPEGSAPLNLTISHVIREGPSFIGSWWLGPSQKSVRKLTPNQGLIV